MESVGCLILIKIKDKEVGGANRPGINDYRSIPKIKQTHKFSNISGS